MDRRVEAIALSPLTNQQSSIQLVIRQHKMDPWHISLLTLILYRMTQFHYRYMLTRIRIDFAHGACSCCCILHLQNFIEMLQNILQSDPSAIVQVGTDDEERIDFFYCQTSAVRKTLELYPEILFFYCQTSAMRKTLELYPEILFLDATYK